MHNCVQRRFTSAACPNTHTVFFYRNFLNHPLLEKESQEVAVFRLQCLKLFLGFSISRFSCFWLLLLAIHTACQIGSSHSLILQFPTFFLGFPHAMFLFRLLSMGSYNLFWFLHSTCCHSLPHWIEPFPGFPIPPMSSHAVPL